MFPFTILFVSSLLLIGSCTESCGDNCTWSFSGGVLFIQGTGPMTDYASAKDAPWYINRISINSIKVEEGITDIGTFAFNEISRMTSIYLPKTLTSIKDFAFDHSPSIESIILPSSLQYIGEGAFSYCGNLKSLIIPDSVTHIGASAFSRCTKLSSVSIGSGVNSLGDSVFSSCGLKSLTISTSLTSIESNTFSNCLISELKLVGTGNIFTPMSVFGSKLANVYIGDGITEIPERAFYSISKLTYVSVPSTITSIGDNAFVGSPIMTLAITGKGKILFNPSRIKTTINTVKIGDEITEIPENAFSSFSLLGSVTIGASVVKINENAFFKCTVLTSVDIPSSVTTINERAFAGCSSLSTVMFEKASSVNYCPESVFENCSSLRKVSVEEGFSRSMICGKPTKLSGDCISSCTSGTSICNRAIDDCDYVSAQLDGNRLRIYPFTRVPQTFSCLENDIYCGTGVKSCRHDINTNYIDCRAYEFDFTEIDTHKYKFNVAFKIEVNEEEFDKSLPNFQLQNKVNPIDFASGAKVFRDEYASETVAGKYKIIIAFRYPIKSLTSGTEQCKELSYNTREALFKEGSMISCQMQTYRYIIHTERKIKHPKIQFDAEAIRINGFVLPGESNVFEINDEPISRTLIAGAIIGVFVVIWIGFVVFYFLKKRRTQEQQTTDISVPLLEASD